ncbi:N-acetyllactosaminide beta-1,6-N-acetylglucosaminyl-transferase-like [Macaca fascicularis]|uniref:N-acetyllactosaminide beta-1,6-N-acetylglucosaminyl-transferase-like n=1 Tax=Macaca fascicularis TaxID=9541 RepID=UPI003D15B4A4
MNQEEATGKLKVKAFEVVLGLMAMSITLLFLYTNHLILQKHLPQGKTSNSSVLAEVCGTIVTGKKMFFNENIPVTPLRIVTCQQYLIRNHYIMEPLSEDEAEFPLAYVMAIHKDSDTFERLFRAIYTPQNIYCVHVDQKVPVAFKDAGRKLLSCFPNVFVASKRESVVYTGISRLQADLHCLNDLWPLRFPGSMSSTPVGKNSP